MSGGQYKSAKTREIIEDAISQYVRWVSLQMAPPAFSSLKG
ncbi:hypothetical protein ACVITL_004555 [Rhizobium pisi]